MGDADITLRHVARRRSAELARPFLPRNRSLEVVSWIDTQLTHLERRADKALRVRVGGELRALQIEFFAEMRADVPRRMFEYLGLLTLALDLEAPGEDPLPIESVAIVLSGREAPWPRWGAHRTAWPGSRFSGAHFRIDAVYQRTLAELRARPGLLWLVFTPLARDATPPAVRAAIEDLRAGSANHDDYLDLCAALVAMAQIDPWKHNLGKEIDSMFMSTKEDEDFLREIYRKVWENLATDAFLGRIFRRRVGRAPSLDEARAIVTLAHERGAEHATDALLDREGDALVHWLLEPTRGTKAKAPRAKAKAPRAKAAAKAAPTKPSKPRLRRTPA